MPTLWRPGMSTSVSMRSTGQDRASNTVVGEPHRIGFACCNPGRGRDLDRRVDRRSAAPWRESTRLFSTECSARRCGCRTMWSTTVAAAMSQVPIPASPLERAVPAVPSSPLAVCDSRPALGASPAPAATGVLDLPVTVPDPRQAAGSSQSTERLCVERKTPRGTSHMSALDDDVGVVLGQVEVGTRTNEIPL